MSQQGTVYQRTAAIADRMACLSKPQAKVAAAFSWGSPVPARSPRLHLCFPMKGQLWWFTGFSLVHQILLLASSGNTLFWVVSPSYVGVERQHLCTARFSRKIVV